MCMEHPEVALKVLKVVGCRLRQLVEIIENLSFGTVRHRLAAYLIRLALQSGKQTSRGIELTLGITNQQLAGTNWHSSRVGFPQSQPAAGRECDRT